MPKPTEAKPTKGKPVNDPVDTGKKKSDPVKKTGKCGFDNPEAKNLIGPDTIIHS